MKTRPYPTPPPPQHALAPPPPPNPDNTTTQELPRISDAPAGRRWPTILASWTQLLLGGFLTAAADTTPLDHGAGVILLTLGAGTTGYHLHKWKDTP